MVKLIIQKIKHIIIGWIFKIFSLENDLASVRLAICNQCTNKIKTSLGDACNECGCILDAKTRVADEHCDLDKW